MRCLIALSTLLTALGPAWGGQKLIDVYGVIQTLDPERGVLTIVRDRQPRSYNLLKRDLPVSHALGHPLKLEDLRPKQRVMLRVNDIEELVTSIRSDADTLWGFATRIERDRQLLHCKLGYAVRTIALTPEVALVRDGEAASLDDMKDGQGIQVTFTPDHRRVVQVRFGKGITGGNPYTTTGLSSGMLTAVDHARKRLRLISLAERYEQQEFEFDAWTYLQLMLGSYVLGELDIHALAAPCKIYLYYDKDTRRVSALHADVPRLVRRTVTRFEPAERRLVLILDDDQRLELTLAADVKVLQGTQPAALDLIKAGVVVTAGLSLDGKEVIVLQTAEK